MTTAKSAKTEEPKVVPDADVEALKKEIARLKLRRKRKKTASPSVVSKSDDDKENKNVKGKGSNEKKKELMGLLEKAKNDVAGQHPPRFKERFQSGVPFPVLPRR